MKFKTGILCVLGSMSNGIEIGRVDFFLARVKRNFI